MPKKLRIRGKSLPVVTVAPIHEDEERDDNETCRICKLKLGDHKKCEACGILIGEGHLEPVLEKFRGHMLCQHCIKAWKPWNTPFEAFLKGNHLNDVIRNIDPGLIRTMIREK